MRYLVLGDLHCRSVWKEIVAKEDYDKVIFLGDYLPPREVEFDDPTDACGFLYEVLTFKDENPDKVILLRGNHCCEMLGYYWGRCNPPVHPKVAAYCRTHDVKNWFLKNTQWVYRIPNTNIVCSHAGITQRWLDDVTKSLQWKELLKQYGSGLYEKDLIECINLLEPSELFAFNANNYWDCSGESETQPCTWIRPYTLIYKGVEGITQVVGHTPIHEVLNLKENLIEEAKNKNMYDKNKSTYSSMRDVWLCDALEERSYLIIEDGVFKPCKI